MADSYRNQRRSERKDDSSSGLQMIGRIPPHNSDAERATLGAMLIDGDAVLKVVDSVKADDFYHKEYAVIYEAMLTLFDKRKPIDLLTLSDELLRREQLDLVGGQAALASLAASVPTATNAGHHATIVREKALLRKLITAAGTIGEMAFSSEDEAAVVLDNAERELFQVTQRFLKQNFVSVRSVLDESFERLGMLTKQDGSIRGLSTGFRHLDGILGGLQRSDLLIVAARPAMGKTSFVMNIAEYVALDLKKTVGMFSLEMSKEQLVDRLLSSIAHVDVSKLRRGNLTEQDLSALVEAQGELAEAPLYIDDAGMASVLEVRAKARRLQAERGLDLLIIDYLQLMAGSSRASSDNRVQEVSEISRGLKALAKELNCPVIALSQLSRAVEARNDKRPMLSDLRESGSIEQDADVVMFLYREDYYTKERDQHSNLAEVIISKHRNGPTGDLTLSTQLQYSRFYDLDPRRAPDSK
jgi:replicative DNA helicase